MEADKNYGYIICHCMKARSEFINPLKPAPPTECTVCGSKKKNNGLRETVFLHALDSFKDDGKEEDLGATPIN